MPPPQHCLDFKKRSQTLCRSCLGAASQQHRGCRTGPAAAEMSSPAQEKLHSPLLSKFFSFLIPLATAKHCKAVFKLKQSSSLQRKHTEPSISTSKRGRKSKQDLYSYSSVIIQKREKAQGSAVSHSLSHPSSFLALILVYFFAVPCLPPD